MNTKTQTQNTDESEADFSELMDLLDANLEDIADLPDYVEYMPSGYYELEIKKAEMAEVEVPKSKGSEEKVKAKVLQFEFAIIKPLELNDESETDKVPKEGSIISDSIFFNKDVQKSLSVFKAKFVEVGAALGINSPKDLLPKLPGLKVGAVVKCKASKKDADRYFISVSQCKII